MRMKKIKAKKKDGRKPHQIEKDKDLDLQGDGRKKLPPHDPPNVTQQQPVKHQIFQHKFITEHQLEASSQFAGKFTSGYYYFCTDNHNHQQCGKLKYLNIKAQIKYDQRQKGGSSNPSQGRSPPTSPGVPQGARRVQHETEKSNSEANNINNDSVTSYSASIASYVFLCSLSSSSSALNQN